MYVQLAWGRARPGTWDDLRQFYVDKVIPFTMGMPGLQERQLWRGTADPDEMGFWSVWGSLQELRNYETSDARRQLAGEAEEFFYPMAYPRGETWIKHFEVVSTSGSDDAAEGYVMMAWGKLRLGSWGPVRAVLQRAGIRDHRDGGRPRQTPTCSAAPKTPTRD